MENENYSYINKGRAIPKYQNQFNNNLADQENLMPKTNGHQKCVTVDCNIPNGSSEGNENEEACKSVETPESSEQLQGLPNEDADDDFSDEANSIGNLSFTSENGLIEEIILLPNNIYSDEELSSDDCVYAYRGELPILEEARDQDDETDFLEMDFDPCSEMENFVELNEINIDAFSPRNVPEPNEVVASNNIEHFNEDDDKPKNTGTIPKTTIFTQNQIGEGNSKLSNDKCLSLELNKSIDGASCSYSYNDYNKFNGQKQFHINSNKNQMSYEDDTENCLDCSEKEFLMQTKQDLSIQSVCRTCYIKQTGSSSGQYRERGVINASSSETDIINMSTDHIVLKALNKIDELKATPPNNDYSKSAEDFSRELIDSSNKQAENVSENAVTIYTIDCDEVTIIEALSRIRVTPNVDVLKQYFMELHSIDTTSMNIPQYLIYMSKKDCNYKTLIEAIKLSCDHAALDIQYFPLDPFSSTPEIVQISSLEISKRWNPDTNLRQIINFRHSHFHTLNVLGKIVNILRQPSRGRYTDLLINIPRYYKSGYITITSRIC